MDIVQEYFPSSEEINSKSIDKMNLPCFWWKLHSLLYLFAIKNLRHHIFITPGGGALGFVEI